jgi:hypothetical protein
MEMAEETPPYGFPKPPEPKGTGRAKARRGFDLRNGERVIVIARASNLNLLAGFKHKPYTDEEVERGARRLIGVCKACGIDAKGLALSFARHGAAMLRVLEESGKA